MIALSPAPAAAIDDAIDDALARIAGRADGLGGAFRELARRDSPRGRRR